MLQYMSWEIDQSKDLVKVATHCVLYDILIKYRTHGNFHAMIFLQILRIILNL